MIECKVRCVCALSKSRWSLMVLAAGAMFAVQPVKAQSIDPQRIATLMAYCVSAIVSNTANISNKPVGIETSGRQASWSGGGEESLLLLHQKGAWDCSVSTENPRTMARAAKGFLRGIKGAEVTTQKWRKGNGEAVLASMCVNDMRITMVANGPIAEAGKFGFTRFTDQYRDIRPC